MVESGLEIGICRWFLCVNVDRLFDFVDNLVTITALEKVNGKSIWWITMWIRCISIGFCWWFFVVDKIVE